jgi:hypothetical protein
VTHGAGWLSPFETHGLLSLIDFFFVFLGGFAAGLLPADFLGVDCILVRLN